MVFQKGNNAKLRRLQRELQDKESTENHLKQTVEYLDRHIDPAVSKGSGATPTTHPALYDGIGNISTSSNKSATKGKKAYGGRK